MDTNPSQTRAKFGVAPVFLTAISTILGAIMFLRFGYAVGSVGFWGALGIVLIGHLVTIPTAMAIAEIATNQKVEGGGEYYIISRSFGLTVGGAIGTALFLSQAVSVAFYVIAFAEAFSGVFAWLRESWSIEIHDKRWVSVPTVILLTSLITLKGADLGVKALYVVIAVLFASLAMFFAGDELSPARDLGASIEQPDDVFLVFAICFPAFTGMTAGVGLSGDLKDPRRAIPLGTLSATLCGMLVYIAICYKLASSASPEDLVGDQLIMARIAVWGPIIPIGLACATVSSALGSFLVAPRTLQAIAADETLPLKGAGRWLARGKGTTNEPFNGSLVTAVIALIFVVLGDVDFVAQIISMFFMVTYGSICLISFLEHFAADPSYRPTFRSRWYISLFGALICLWLMFQMSAPYALLSIGLMFGLYLLISHGNSDKRGLSLIVQGAIFQLSRKIQVFLQKSRKAKVDSWRPSIVCISKDSFRRLAAFDFLRWISHRYGFGTYIHHIDGYLSSKTNAQAGQAMSQLVRRAEISDSNVYVDTIVSPSYTVAVSQLIQFPGISGKENNMLLFEFSKSEPGGLGDIVDNYSLAASVGFDVCVLASSERGFGYCRQVHVWLTPADYENAGLMILLAYILLGHPDWKGAVIRIFSVLPEADLASEKAELDEMVRSGRLPISAMHIEVVPTGEGGKVRDFIQQRSADADLVMVGFLGEALEHLGEDLFLGYDKVGNVLFVNTKKEIQIASVQPSPIPDVEAEPASSGDKNGAEKDEAHARRAQPPAESKSTRS